MVGRKLQLARVRGMSSVGLWSWLSLGLVAL